MQDPAPSVRVAAIICAAGSGTRFGGSQGSKLDADLHGQPVLIRSVEAIARQPQITKIVVAGPADPELLARFRSTYEGPLESLRAEICPGGALERYETVNAALNHLLQSPAQHAPAENPAQAVLVHDAARPCTPDRVVRAILDALTHHAAVVPAVPVADTLKRARPAKPQPPPQANPSSPGQRAPVTTIDHTVDRRGLYACQTPQGFHLDLLRRAYAQNDLASTDDAQLVERLGEPVTLVEGDPRNIKITRPQDLDLARALWPGLNG